MNSITSNAVADCLKHSTNEINTGKTWIDGKPIYRKVVASLSVVVYNENWTNLCSASLFPNAQTLIYGTLIDDLSRIINSNELILDDGYLKTEIFAGGARRITAIILEYTKTTD